MIVGAIVIAAFIAFGIAYIPRQGWREVAYFFEPDWREPDVGQMRAFRLSGFSDERLRELYQKATAEADRQRDAAATARTQA